MESKKRDYQTWLDTEDCKDCKTHYRFNRLTKEGAAKGKMKCGEKNV